MAQLILMQKESAFMNVPDDKVQAYLDAGWTKADPQPIFPTIADNQGKVKAVSAAEAKKAAKLAEAEAKKVAKQADNSAELPSESDESDVPPED